MRVKGRASASRKQNEAERGEWFSSGEAHWNNGEQRECGKEAGEGKRADAAAAEDPGGAQAAPPEQKESRKRPRPSAAARKSQRESEQVRGTGRRGPVDVSRSPRDRGIPVAGEDGLSVPFPGNEREVPRRAEKTQASTERKGKSLEKFTRVREEARKALGLCQAVGTDRGRTEGRVRPLHPPDQNPQVGRTRHAATILPGRLRPHQASRDGD